MSRAAVVSSSRRCTSTGSVEGRRARQRSLAASPTASWASSSSTRGSSKVWMDFSNSSVSCVMVFPLLYVVCLRRLRGRFEKRPLRTSETFNLLAGGMGKVVKT